MHDAMVVGGWVGCVGGSVGWVGTTTGEVGVTAAVVGAVVSAADVGVGGVLADAAAALPAWGRVELTSAAGARGSAPGASRAPR